MAVYAWENLKEFVGVYIIFAILDAYMKLGPLARLHMTLCLFHDSSFSYIPYFLSQDMDWQIKVE